MRGVFLIIGLMLSTNPSWSAEEITPYKYTDQDKGMPAYDIPSSSRFTAKRLEADAPDSIYYFTKPKADNYPIAILCGGSTTKDDIGSIIHFHRYFLQEFMDLGAAVLTVEQWGVDGNKVNAKEFMDHYTRTQRLKDHQAVIEHLKSNPPKGWNGKLIFLGVSEGGPIVTTLTAKYSDITMATINWSGAGDWSWREELWMFIEGMKENASCWMKLCDLMPRWLPFSFGLPKTREAYDLVMNKTLENPISDEEFLGMTYQYHADALLYAAPRYTQIKTPLFLKKGCLVYSDGALCHCRRIFIGMESGAKMCPKSQDFEAKGESCCGARRAKQLLIVLRSRGLGFRGGPI